METHGITKAFLKVKRHRPHESKDVPPVKKIPSLPITGNVFQGVCVHIIPAGIGNARCDIFQQQIVQNGGQVEAAYGPSCTHVVVDESVDMARVLRLLKMETFPPAVQLVKCTWLSACISEKKLLSTKDYRLHPFNRSLQDAPSEEPKQCAVSHTPVPDEMQLPDHKSAQDNSADTVGGESHVQAAFIPLMIASPPFTGIRQHQEWEAGSSQQDYKVPETHEEIQEEDGVSQNDLEALIKGVKRDTGLPNDVHCNVSEKPEVLGKWVCAQSSYTKNKNHNCHITDKLEQLAKVYTHTGDKWRALSYSKAVNALKSHPKSISSYEEACKIPGIGKRMADKIVEIMESGHLRKLDHFGDTAPVMEMFTNIWGVGAKTAQLWYQQGFRTLEDIRTKATLTHTIRIGLKHYDDFLDRMPRSEAAAIEKTVREAAHSLIPELLVVACGSYRRGKPTCGDVDVLITHPDGQSHKGIFNKLLQILHQSAKLASPTEATMNQAQRCVGNKNQSYICESGHCCEEMQCCNYYYELWWFWLMCALILILTLGCVFHHRRIKHRLHQQQRQHEINLIAYREACNYTSPPFYFRFIPSYLLPDYDDLPTHRLTPPPPYCNLNSLPPELVNSGQEETHCLSRQVTPAPVTSTALCSSPDIVVLENSRENQHREAGRDREKMLKQGMDHKEQERDMEVGEDEKDELMGRRRHFTGDSGIEVCLCSQRAESNTPKELEEVFGNESKNSSLVDYCNGCEARDDKSDEKAAEFGVSQTSPEASQSLCLYLGTINEQEGPQEYQS